MMWNSKRKGVRVFRVMITSFLILCLFTSFTIKGYGPVVSQAVEDAQTTYVSDVRLFYSMDSADAAKKKCKDSGYIPVEGDLNKGAGKNYVIMGYKETTDKNDAICSIRTLSMDAGYQLTDYKKLKESYKNTNVPVIDAISAAADEFISNYESKAPKALMAYKGLNLIDVPEKNNIKLGDYIVSGQADWNFYAEVVARASAGTINAIVGYLSLGVSGYLNEVNAEDDAVSMSWAEAIENSLVWDEVDEATTEDARDDLYTEYGDDARAFHKKLQEFAAYVDNATRVFDEATYAQEIGKYQSKTDGQIVDDKQGASENDQAAIYLALYEELEKYNVRAGETTTLGEYLLDLGHETSDDVDLTKIYPVIGSMTYAQRCIATMTGLLGLAPSLGENEENQKTEETISEAAENIQKILGKNSYSVWMNDNEKIKDKKVAFTSDATRKNSAQTLLDNYDPSTWKEKADEVMKWVNLALGIVSCVLILAKFQAVATVLALVPAGICAIAAACGLTCAATTISVIAGKIAGAAAAATGPVGWIILAVLVVSMIVIFAVSEILKYIKENKDYDYTDVPEFVAECATSGNNEYLTYYQGVGSEECTGEKTGDYHGSAGISDVNGRMGFHGWNCMYFSKDTNTGTPLIVKKGESPFVITYGDGNAKKGYDNVKAFGMVSAANMNYLMKEDKEGGVFVHYRTEKSILNENGSDENVGATDKSSKYIKDIIVASADTEKRAKAKLTAKGYEIWDHNIAGDARYTSRNAEWAYTYLGYTTTTNPKQAITDIRVATFFPEANKELSFGGVKYGCSGNLGYKADSTTEDKEYPSDLDGLWITTDEKAGTPIGADKLHLVSDHKNGDYMNKQGWVPVTTFSGVPYNFASTRDVDGGDKELGRLANADYRYTCYQTSEDNKWDSKANYIYYEPETKYTEGTKYLSGLFFTFGTDSESTAAKVGETLATYSQLTDRMKKTPNAVMLGNDNLAKSYVFKGYIVESNQKYMNLWYTWSYNPYRAITDIKAFQGTTFSSELPYTLNKPVKFDGKNAVNTAYDSVTVVSQRTTIKCKYVTRGIGPENAYMTPTGLIGANKQVRQGTTQYQPGGYGYTKGKMPFISSGLYVSGPVKGVDGLTLNDVVATSGYHEAEVKDGVISANLGGEKTLSGEAASGEFNSIQEMKAPHEKRPFNIAYPEWTDPDGETHAAGNPLYIYTRSTAHRGKYISKLFVGSFSFGQTGLEENKDTNHEVAKQVDLNALVEANAQAVDEVIPVNAAVVPGRAWYDSVMNPMNKHGSYVDMQGGWYEPVDAAPGNGAIDENTETLPCAPPYYDIVGSKGGHHNAGGGINNAEFVDRPASYISVERTDSADDAVKGILLFKAGKDVKTAAEKIQVDGIEYRCASTSTPIIMAAPGENNSYETQEYTWKTQKYFLYYTMNSGASPGQPLTDLKVDDRVFNSKQATALCADEKDKVESGADGKKTITDRAKPYGESEVSTFIHAKYEKAGNMYFNKIYTANGSTEKEALFRLLEQGCTEYCDMNLNEGAVLSAEEKKANSKRVSGDYIYFGYRGYALDQEAIDEKTSAEAKQKEIDKQLEQAIYDVVCTVGEPYHSEGIMTERYQVKYSPVIKLGKNDDPSGTDLNAGTNGPEIYMYYTTPYLVNNYNKKTGKDVRKTLSTEPKEYLKSPLTSIAFARYDRVPYTDGKAAAGNTNLPWEYVLYSDYSSAVDLNDGAVVLDNDLHLDNNRISMFVQRESGFVKPAAEITGGYLSGTAEIGEMWLNQ